MVVQASDRLQSTSKAPLRTSPGNQPTRSQDTVTSRQELELRCVMGESSAFTTAASFVDPAEEDTHTSVKQEEEASAAGRPCWRPFRDILPTN